MKNQLIRGVIIGLLSLLFSTFLWRMNILTPLEDLTWDTRVKVLADESKANPDIVVILLGQDSFDWGEEEQGLSWPWPREILTTIIDYPAISGAKSIAFDVLYTEPSIYGVWDDEAFGYSIESSNIFIGSTTLDSTISPKVQLQWDIKIEGLNDWLNDSSTDFLESTNITKTIDEVQKYSRYLSNVQTDPDEDGIYRRAKLFDIYNGKVIPSHALASYLVNNQNAVLSIKKGILTVDDKNIPIDNKGNAILNYRGASGTFTIVKAANVVVSAIAEMDGKKPLISPETFNGKHVFFGYSAAGLLDLRATPISGKDPGVEIHATMLDNLLSNDFVKEQGFLFTFILTLFLTITAGALYSRFQGVFRGLIMVVLYLSIPVFLLVIQYNNSVWFHVVYVELSLLLTFAGAGILNFVTEGKQKRYIKTVFKQYLSPDFIENLLEDPEKLKLGGEKKELSIFFSDLEGFTTISEGLTPEKLTELINEYLTAMTDIILEEGGTIDKYEGDAIIAFWNAPLDYEDHAIRCVRAALRCQNKLKEMQPYFFNKTGHNLKMRIGINTGTAVVGNMGSNTRFDYTMLGDSVNLAARLEGVNKQFGTYTMISKTTLDSIKNYFPARELGKVKVVGKNNAITVYEPMNKNEYDSNIEKFTIFKKGLEYFYSGDFENALKSFCSIQDDPVAKRYIETTEKLTGKDITDWDGVLKMTTK